jgi:hypothetical protein
MGRVPSFVVWNPSVFHNCYKGRSSILFLSRSCKMSSSGSCAIDDSTLSLVRFGTDVSFSNSSILSDGYPDTWRVF